MKLRFNRNSQLEVIGIGVFSPGFKCRIDDEILAEKYINSGYFDEIKEEVKKINPIKIKVKKSKKKGDNLLCQLEHADI